MSDNVIQFEPFKHARDWDKDYPKFLGNAEKCFSAKTDTEQTMKRLYYATRYLQGIANAVFVFNILGIDCEELKRGKKYIIALLEDLIMRLK